jgi:hypothetical protein
MSINQSKLLLILKIIIRFKIVIFILLYLSVFDLGKVYYNLFKRRYTDNTIIFLH